MSIAGLNIFPRPKFKNETARDRAELQQDKFKARLDRQQAELVEREAALDERERRLRKRERAAEQEDQGSPTTASSGKVVLNHRSEPGATAPGELSDRQRSEVAALILQGDAVRRGAVATDDVPLPTDSTARMIASFARGTARTQEPQLSEAAKMILNADKMRNGGDIDEAI